MEVPNPCPNNHYCLNPVLFNMFPRVSHFNISDSRTPYSWFSMVWAWLWPYNSWYTRAYWSTTACRTPCLVTVSWHVTVSSPWQLHTSRWGSSSFRSSSWTTSCTSSGRRPGKWVNLLPTRKWSEPWCPELKRDITFYRWETCECLY